MGSLRNRVTYGLVCAVFALYLALIPRVYAQSYSFQHLDVPGAENTWPQGINNAGQIVGYYSNAGDQNVYAFVYFNGGFSSVYCDEYPPTMAFGINNLQEILVETGQAYTVGGGICTFFDFPPPNCYYNYVGTSFNDFHDRTGFCWTDNGYQGFLCSGGTCTALVYPGAGWTIAYGINNAQQIVGVYTNGGPPCGVSECGFVYFRGNFALINYPPGLESTGAVYSINNLGQIAGEGFVIYAPGWFIPIRGAQAFGINDAGDIVGRYYDPSDGKTHGFLAHPPACLANLTTVKMLHPNNFQLELDVSGEFSDDPTSSKSLSVSTTLNGIPLNDSFQLPAGATGTQSNAFIFDLTDKSVPRFTDNAIFPVVVGQSENGNACNSLPVNGVVLLPTIVIPGIKNGHGGDGTFPDLESYFGNAFYVIGNLGVGEAYELRQNPSPIPGCASAYPGVETYPTLYTLSYDTNGAKFFQGAEALNSCIESVMSLTWADDVNIVGHSRGGLVGRRYLENRVSPPVDRFIMAETPNLGALKTAWEQFYPLLWMHWYDNLYPVWPWERPNDRAKYRVDPPNEELDDLNTQQVLPTNVAYTIVYSKLKDTQVTRTGNWPYRFTDLPGDGIVPWFSQQGKMYDPNQHTQDYLDIPAFVNANITKVEFDGPHKGYLSMQPVLHILVNQLLSQTDLREAIENSDKRDGSDPRAVIKQAGAQPQ